ncbi:MAG: phage integrase SAM-like domain-containing protein [Phaeodactylibacter sp.]|nr:phage integrase SAM-like domain-containing protein [Phaeodactylibacter sp.]
MGKLPKPRFNLKSPKAKRETLILMFFRYRGKRLQYSTGLNIHPKDWDTKAQRPIAQARRQDLFVIERELDNLSTYCMDIFIGKDYGAISVEEFKRQLDIKMGKTAIPDAPQGDQEPEEKTPSFFEFIEQEIAEMKATNMKQGSLKVFKRHAAILKEFALEQFPDGKMFAYEDVDWNFRLKLIDWLAGRNVQLAYGNKTLKILRQYLERARRKKLHGNTDYQGVGWTVTRKKATGQKVILTLEELNHLAGLKLSGHLAKVRDICLIGAGTGQRYSDFSRYTPDNFYKTLNGISILSLISTKTDTPAKIPLNLFTWLIPVLEKHGYSTPKMSMQKFNDGIKEVCKLAGFDEQVLKIEQYMGRKARVEKYHAPKYEEVSSHICRRSFATNLYRMGYRLAQIMPLTGHATESQLREYIGIDNEMNAEEIAFSIMERRNNGRKGSAGTLKVVNS